MELKCYQVSVKELSGKWCVYLKNVGCLFEAESSEEALRFKEEFNALELPKGNLGLNFRRNASRAFWEIGSRFYREQRYGRGVNNG